MNSEYTFPFKNLRDKLPEILEKKSLAVFLLDWHWIQSEMCFSYARTKYTCSWLLALLAILYWHTATFSSIL